VDRQPSEQVEAEREEHSALGWLALVSVAIIFWLVRPIGVGILFGVFMAFMAQPLFERLKPRLGAAWSSVATVVGSSLALVVAIGGLGWLFVARGTLLATRLINAFDPGTVATGALARVSAFTNRFGITSEEIEERGRALAAGAAERAASLAETIVSATGSALLGLLFAMLAMQYILRNWHDLARRAEETFPLRPEYTAALFAEFRKVGRTTLLGAIGTAVAQGMLSTIGYALASVPEPMFFGAATALASFVPAVGVLLVIVPVTIGLFLVGSPGHAVVELVWGLAVVVGVCDYLIRPRLVRGDNVPTLVTFIALFGGIQVFGLKGLILGPVLMALALAVLRLYGAETRSRRHLDLDASP
jgi:predicted PurR-regulated permease PerM